MSRNRNVEDLSVDELRYLLVAKRRAARQDRLEHFRRTGRVIVVAPDAGARTIDSMRADAAPDEGAGASSAAPRSKRKVVIDRLLLLVEFAAVAGLLLILFNGINLLNNLNREASSALTLPTLTPTPLISVVVLPSGHTPPDDLGNVRFNEAEIPEHLRPLVQSLASVALPTPGPEQAQRIQINAISVDAPVVMGDGWEQLKKGVGQHVGTPNPGQNGNIVLSAHNDVFGQIFKDLDQLKVGDRVVLFTNQRQYTYVITNSQIVLPTQVEVMAATAKPVVTLISCYPYRVDNKRIVITAELESKS